MYAAAVSWTLLAGAQTNVASIYVDDPRPVAAAIQSLLERFPVVITYEAPRFEYSRDIKDVTHAVRNPLAPPSTQRVLVPRGGILQASYELSVATGQPTDMGEALRRILEANNAGPAGGRFRVLEAGGVFHVVPTAIRNAEGAWVPQASVLDTRITISVHDVNGFQLLDAIATEIEDASGVRIGVAGENFNNTLARYRGDMEAADEVAREVLLRALHAISERFTWRLFYGAGVKYYVLNLDVAAERPNEQPQFMLPPPPRPGDPTPAFVIPNPSSTPAGP
jgi:hypothetical protein